MELIFWLLLALVFYTYLGYGIVLFVLVRIKRIPRGFIKKAVLDEDGFVQQVTRVWTDYAVAVLLLAEVAIPYTTNPNPILLMASAML